MGTSITVKILLKNKLNISLDIRNIRLMCSLGDSKLASSELYTQETQNLVLEPLKSKELLLKLTPIQTGELTLENIQWELFEVVRCSRPLFQMAIVGAGKRSREVEQPLKFNIVEASGECKMEFLLDGQDLTKNRNIVNYECRKGTIRVTNMSSTYSAKNSFVSCSHPIMLNFLNRKLFDELKPNASIDVPITLRAGLLGENVVKFLMRHEVDGVSEKSKFRFQRLQVNLSTQNCFEAFYRISMSSRQPGTFLVNLALNANNLAPRNSNFEKAQIQAVEIISKDNQFKICKRDEGGRFFSLEKHEGVTSEDSILKIEEQIRSIKDDPELQSLLDKELQYKKVKHSAEKATDTVDFILHWSMPTQGKRGFITSKGQPLFPAQVAQQHRCPLQVAFKFPKHLTPAELPCKIPLEITITPLLDNIQKVTLQVNSSQFDSADTLTWMGKVKHNVF